MGEGLGDWVKRRKGLHSISWPLQNSHGDVKYSVGNISNNIVITMYGARSVLNLWWGSLCKLHKFLTTMEYTCNYYNIEYQLYLKNTVTWSFRFCFFSHFQRILLHSKIRNCFLTFSFSSMFLCLSSHLNLSIIWKLFWCVCISRAQLYFLPNNDSN